MSSTLRPHRSPSPSPSPEPPINLSNPAKLTRQSLGPPTSSGPASHAKGFGALGVGAGLASPTSPAHPRHVSSSVALGMGGYGGGAGGVGGRESLSPRPSGVGQGRAVSAQTGGRPSSEFIPGRETKTPEAEQIDQWFKHLASWEATLEEMAAASTDQNFTEELGAIEQWFRVLSEAERTAALYSLLQHSTPVQIRFFISVLHHMAQSDPMTALLSPAPPATASLQAGLQAQMESKLAGMNLKSPSAGGGAGFPGSPGGGQPGGGAQYLAPEDAQAAKNRARQNRISAPGTLQPHDRWQGQQLDQVIERGSSPGVESDLSARSRSRSKSPTPEPRPKSTDFSGKAGQPHGEREREREASASYPRSPRVSGGAGGVGLGIEAQSPVASPFANSGSWASMVNTPMVPGFNEHSTNSTNANHLSQALSNMANMQLGSPGYVPLEDARKYRRPGAGSGAASGTTSRNVSGQYNDDGEMVSPRAAQPGSAHHAHNVGSPLLPGHAAYGAAARSPLVDQFGLGGLGGLGIGADANSLASLGMGFGLGGNLGGLNGLNGLQGLGGLPGLNGLAGLNPAQAAQMLAMQQQYQSAPSPGLGGGLNPPLRSAGLRSGASQGRRSPMLGKSHSPAPGQTAGGGGGAGGGAGVAGPDDVDLKVLDDVSGWLRVLRLHKYTSNFEKSNWKEMIQMNDQDLQDNGISAQGARTKFLKVFYNVRTKMDIPHPAGQEEYAPGAGSKDGDK
ncbi:hypothetical protein IAT38_004627 [Cryptococcus sp. DSM 104549]